MKRSIFHTVILICLLGSLAQAQFRYEEQRRPVYISTGYLALIDLPSEDAVFRHGATVAVQPMFVNKYRIKQQRKTAYNRIIDRQIGLDARISYYHRPELHHTLQFSAGPVFRLTLPEGIYFDFRGGVGYLRTFLAGDHFTYSNGDITTARALGHNHFMIEASGGAGWDFYRSNKYPVYLFASVGLMTYFPNNSAWVYQPVFMGGLGFVLSRIDQEYSE